MSYVLNNYSRENGRKSGRLFEKAKFYANMYLKNNNIFFMKRLIIFKGKVVENYLSFGNCKLLSNKSTVNLIPSNFLNKQVRH